MIPLSYDLTIKTNFPDAFSGTAEIAIEVTEPTREITLNLADPIVLLGAVLVHSAEHSRRLVPSSAARDEKRELVTLAFDEEIAVGRVELGLRWEGSLQSDTLLGYYRMDLEDGSYHAVTQFQPTMARRAFPCFDHPAKKAVFTIQLIIPSTYGSLSNGGQASKTRLPQGGAVPSTALLTAAFLTGAEGRLAEGQATGEEGGTEWDWIKFAPTPMMSTYLVAWTVAQFSCIESSYTSPLTGEVVPLKLHAASASQHVERGQAQLALETLARVMPLYEAMFGLPYELGKLDVVVCDAFDCGAMENWGLITGRTARLLFDPAQSGIAEQMSVVTCIAHEAAHQWFGNLVTLAWWSDLWLNEAFATLMGEVIVLDELEPSWNAHAAYVKFHRSAGLQLDALRSSHPVQMAVEDDSEASITHAFDAISYEKGAAVLKMLSQLVGQDKLIEGTRNYLRANAHGSTTAADLWREMSKVADGVDVEGLMESWITKVGFPIVTAETTPTGFKLTQNRFLSTADPTAEEDSTLWPIPLSVREVGGAGEVIPVLMSTRELTVELPEFGAKLYKLNADTSGAFRVKYPAEYLDRLARATFTTPSPLRLADRLGLVQDALVLASAGYSSTSSSLSFILQLAGSEREYLVWQEVAETFRRLLDAWWERPAAELAAVRAFGRELCAPLRAEVGLEPQEGDSAERRMMRFLCVAALAQAEDAGVVAHLQQQFVLLASGQAPPEPASGYMVLLVVSEAVAHGGAEFYQIAQAIYASPPTPQHALAAIAGLTSARDPALLQQTAGMMMSGAVAEQDMAQFLIGLARNESSRRLLWSLFQQAWPMLRAKFEGTHSLGMIIQWSFRMLTTEQDAQEVEHFFADEDCAAFEGPLHQALDEVRGKARWVERDAGEVRQWLRQEGYLVKDEERSASEASI